jgi:N4-(beta-N-acetylglucosaminyl)-L-asparaginase
MRQGKTPTEACKIIVERINRIKKEKAKDIQICFIAVNKNGDFGSFSLHKGFNFAVHTNEGNKLHESKSLD